MFLFSIGLQLMTTLILDQSVDYFIHEWIDCLVCKEPSQLVHSDIFTTNSPKLNVITIIITEENQQISMREAEK